MRNKEKEKARREFLYRKKYLPMYLLFISVYPFHLEDLEGEIWAWVSGYEGLYQISNFGRIKSFPRNGTGKEIKILRPGLTKDGYLRIYLYKNNTPRRFNIHRLVAETFISNSENKPHVNHKDGNKFNNCVKNLEWSTVAENNQHAYDAGLKKAVGNSADSKLTSEQIYWIREHYIPRNKEYGERALAKKFNVTQSTISNVILRKHYKDVD